MTTQPGTKAFSLRGRAALITGGSLGLGRALGEALGAEGARVALVAREPVALAAAVERIRAAGGEAHAIVADVGDKQAIHRIAGQAAALLGPIDVLINAASTLGPTPLPLLLDTECEDFAHVLEVNLLGPFRLSKLVLGSMALRAEGVVINVSSDAAVEAYPGWGAYGVSKAALDQLGRIWAAELPGGVRVLTVDPGEMDTRMHADAMPDADHNTLARPEAVAARIVALLRDPARAPSGARLSVASMASEPEVRP